MNAAQHTPGPTLRVAAQVSDQLARQLTGLDPAYYDANGNERDARITRERAQRMWDALIAIAGSGAQHAAQTELVSMTMSGNLHDVTRYVSRFGLSDFFVQAESSGGSSIVVFRLPVGWPVDHLGPVPAEGRTR